MTEQEAIGRYNAMDALGRAGVRIRFFHFRLRHHARADPFAEAYRDAPICMIAAVEDEIAGKMLP